MLPACKPIVQPVLAPFESQENAGRHVSESSHLRSKPSSTWQILALFFRTVCLLQSHRSDIKQTEGVSSNGSRPLHKTVLRKSFWVNGTATLRLKTPSEIVWLDNVDS